MIAHKSEPCVNSFPPPRAMRVRELRVPGRGSGLWLKRAFDAAVSAVMLLALSPIFLVVSLLIVLDDPKGGPFYSQDRCGRGGRLFRMHKFRSMRVGADQMLEDLLKDNEMSGPAFKMKDDPRITRVGHILRATSLDELPQLLNILKGEMTFVGPRPPLPREVALYDDYQFQRLYVTPGLTCLWQIAPGRNDIPFDQWVEMDIDYIVNRSLWADLKIMFGTVRAVLRSDGR